MEGHRQTGRGTAIAAVTMAVDPSARSSMRTVSNLMDQQQFNRIGRALADPRRMEIFESIGKEGEVAGATLATESAVSRPTISHHLKELSTTGLIKPRKEAKFRFYRVDRRVWAEYLKEMRQRVPTRFRKSSGLSRTRHIDPYRYACIQATNDCKVLRKAALMTRATKKVAPRLREVAEKRVSVVGDSTNAQLELIHARYGRFICAQWFLKITGSQRSCA